VREWLCVVLCCVVFFTFQGIDISIGKVAGNVGELGRGTDILRIVCVLDVVGVDRDGALPIF